MKKQNLTNLCKKDGKTFTKDNVEMYNWACERFTMTNSDYVKFYGTTSSINGINDTWTRHIKHFLEACGVDYNTGNDAPRGGASGNFVAVKTKDIAKLMRFVRRHCSVLCNVVPGWGFKAFSITIK